MNRGFVVGDRPLGTSGDVHPLWNASYGAVSSYWALAASVIGESHLAHGMSRDDAVVIRCVGPWLAVGVSDGVGSRPLSRLGATGVADALTIALLSDLTPRLRPVPPEPLPPSRQKAWERIIATLPERTEVMSIGNDGVLPAGSLTWWIPFDDRGGEGQKPADTPAIPARTSSTDALSHPERDRTELATAEEMTDHIAADIPKQMMQTGSDPNATASAAVQARVRSPAEARDLAGRMRAAFEAAHKTVWQRASTYNLQPGDLSCTALALILNTTTGQFAVGQVGDGTFLGLREDGNVTVFLDPDDDSDLQKTYAIGSPKWEEHFSCKSFLPGTGADSWRSFFVMTDGISSDLLYAPRETMERWARSAQAGLDQMSTPQDAAGAMVRALAMYNRQGSFDDRTLAIVTRRDSTSAHRQDNAGRQERAGADSD